jgi:hypothetical protein
MWHPSDKPEFPPLLEIGRYVMGLAELRDLCVEAFPLSTTREPITCGLELVVNRLSGAGVEGEIWVDGSYLTKKIDPEDCDLILRTTGEFYDNGSDGQREAIDWVGGNLKAAHLCDSYVHHEWESSNSNHWLGIYMHSYWMKQWGFSRGGELKGIAVIELPI